MKSFRTLRPHQAAARIVFALTLLVALPALAQRPNPPDLPSRARGAERVVVATVAQVESMPFVNEFGDQLIITRATLAVDETWKGPFTPTVTVDVEGGTFGGLTLKVSDMQSIAEGERGVFFIESSGGRNVPHGRGHGILKLTSDNVTRSGRPLDEIRASIGRQR